MQDDGLRDIIVRVMRQVAPEADLSGVDPDSSLQDELDLDSMGFLNFVTGLHEETGVDIPERDYPDLTTLNGCISYFRRSQVTDEVASATR